MCRANDTISQPLTRRRLLASSVLAAASAMAGGCGAGGGARQDAKRQSPGVAQGKGQTAHGAVAPITNTDACASRLHDISGSLLYYHEKRKQLPPSLDELRRVAVFQDVGEFVCPVSRMPYVYNPVGVMTAGEPARVILYDPAPSHSFMRWAIAVIEPPAGGGPLITKVIALPESHFTLQAPSQRRR